MSWVVYHGRGTHLSVPGPGVGGAHLSVPGPGGGGTNLSVPGPGVEEHISVSLGLGVEEHISVSGRVEDTSQYPGHVLILRARSLGLEVKIMQTFLSEMVFHFLKNKMAYMQQLAQLPLHQGNVVVK